MTLKGERAAVEPVAGERAHLSFGAPAQAQLGAGGAQRGLQGLSRDGLDVVAGGRDEVLPLVGRRGSLGLAAVGGLVAGLTWRPVGLCPRAAILTWGVSPRAFGRSHPRPRPVLLSGVRGYRGACYRRLQRHDFSSQRLKDLNSNQLSFIIFISGFAILQYFRILEANWRCLSISN